MTADFAAAVESAERAQLIADLKAARAELVARGRCRQELVRDGKVCVLGAIGVATVEGFMSMPAWQQRRALAEKVRPMRARDALDEELHGAVWAFNDNRITLDQDVLDLFDKTLAGLGGLG